MPVSVTVTVHPRRAAVAAPDCEWPLAAHRLLHGAAVVRVRGGRNAGGARDVDLKGHEHRREHVLPRFNHHMADAVRARGRPASKLRRRRGAEAVGGHRRRWRWRPGRWRTSRTTASTSCSAARSTSRGHSLRTAEAPARKVWAACIPGEASRSKSADAVGAEARRRPKRIVDGRLGGRRRIRNDVGSVDGAPAGESVAHAPLLLSSGRRA